MLSYSSLYEILRVSAGASTEEIKSAFRKLAMIYHPDKNNNSPESQTEFILIYNAYSVLTDPVKREEYDTYLRTSSILKKQAKPRAAGKAVLPGMTGSIIDSEAVFSRINYLLWEIEDLLRDSKEINLEKEYSGKSFWQYILIILTFIDKWVLAPAGFPDYFMQARKMTSIDPMEYIRQINVKSGHRPFVDVRDYFYNIRKRMDKFMKNVHFSDLVKTIPEGIRLIDCLFEAENLAVHYLSFLNRALSGEAASIEPFRHSNSCFSG